jgi:GNAT superfamily N-acetyltransferase
MTAKSFIDATLATRLEDAQAWRSVHYALAQGARQPEAQSTVFALAGGQLIFAAPGSPVNRAIGLGMAAPITVAEFDMLEEFYRVRGESARIDLCPLADLSLLRLLRQRQYQISIFQNVLVCPLPQPMPPSAAASQIEVTVAHPAEGELWINTVAMGFCETPTPPAADIQIATPNFYARNATCFFARVEGEVAGGGAIYIHNGVAELGGTSTLVEFRRRGVQTALLYHRLATAHAAGCDLALVITSPGSASQKNVERVGFSLAYTKVRMEHGG